MRRGTSLDQILGRLIGKGGGSSTVLSAAMGLLGSRGEGSLTNLLGAFHRAGVDEKAASWVGAGENQALSSAEVKQALA